MQPQTAKQKTKPHLSARQKEERSKAIQYNPATNTLKADSKDNPRFGLRCPLYLKALFPSPSLHLSVFLSLSVHPLRTQWACSSLQFDVSTGFFFPPCRALICKVSTFLCVCVVWFVVVGSLFLIRSALTKLSPLLPHLGLAWLWNLYSESHPSLNCFKRLVADLTFPLAPVVVSFYPSFPLYLLGLPCTSISIPSHSPLFLHSLPGSDTNGGMKGWEGISYSL